MKKTEEKVVETEVTENTEVAEVSEEKAEKKELAEQVLEKVAASDNVTEADMASLAKEVDENLTATSPAFTTAGSEDDVLDEKVKAAALSLEEGELASEVIEGEAAYYVVRLDKMLDEDATQTKKDSIISEREQDRYDELLKEWEDAAEMNIDEKVWKKLTITDSKSFMYKTEDESSEDTAQ